MARVDHKKIKQLIAKKEKTVTDRQLFTSRAMAAHFEDMAAAQTRRYGYRRRVKVKLVWKPKELASAKTDNSRIWLNAGHARLPNARAGRSGMSRSARCSPMSWAMCFTPTS